MDSKDYYNIFRSIFMERYITVESKVLGFEKARNKVCQYLVCFSKTIFHMLSYTHIILPDVLLLLLLGIVTGCPGK